MEAYEIEVGVTANVFKRGHRVRLEVTSSNFPRFDRNLNTGNDPATDTEIRVAHQTVLHDRAHPSHLILPVIPTRLIGGTPLGGSSLGGAEQCPQSAFRRLDRRWPMRRLPALQPGLRKHGHNRRVASNRAARRQLFQRR